MKNDDWKLKIFSFPQVERWMLKKAKDADAVNLENEQMTRFV